MARMDIIPFLSDFQLGKGELRKEGYMVYPLLGDSLSEYIKEIFCLNYKYIKVMMVHVPEGIFVADHIHRRGMEIFIPIKEVFLTIDGKFRASKFPVKVLPGSIHSVVGKQTFYVVKAYNNRFDKLHLQAE